MTSIFLERINETCIKHPGRLAYFNSRGGVSNCVTYSQLNKWSDNLAAYLMAEAPTARPVVVYGHKSPYMLVCFLAAVKAGLPYSPIDIAYPPDRVDDILDQIGHPLVLCVADSSFAGNADLAFAVLERDRVQTICEKDPSSVSLTPVDGDDVFYLLFTSGSTGRPKGVQMPSRCVDAFMNYFNKFFTEGDNRICFNRVPYTFDVSLFDIIGALPSGYSLFALESEDEASMSASFQALSKSGLTTWISTPSYIEMCLADPAFNAELLPRLDTVVLCGEVFRNSTALKLADRFPDAKVFNTYGPTETQAVTDILVTRELAEAINPLPVGFLNPDIEVQIRDLDTGEPLSTGQEGEVVLSGATVSLGYFGRPDLTEAVFEEKMQSDGAILHSYRTGDKGYVDDQGRLFCLGRLDFQVKLNGFRVELGDVEQGLAVLPEVKEAVVLPVQKDDRVTHLVAHVLLADKDIEPSFKTGQAIKAALREHLPEYMIPKKIVFHESFPSTVNGKIDRKALA